MRRTATVFFYLFLVYPFLLATTNELELVFTVPPKREVDPGVTINSLVTLVNKSTTDKVVQIKFDTNSDNWKLVTDYSSIKVPASGTVKKIIGIQIPSNNSAGDYVISAKASEVGSNQAFGTLTIPVVVKPKYGLSISKLSAPAYIFSGSDIKVNYLIQNLSNVDVNIKTKTINGINIEEGVLSLPKDSSITTSYTTTTTKKVEGYAQHTVIFIAQIADKPETETSVHAAIDIFPSEAVKFDKFERFPVQVSGLVAASNRHGKQFFSSMFDVVGTGELGKSGNSLDFHLRGPDRTGNPLFGMNDEYYLKFKSPHLLAAVGDYNFGLSELTESSRSGRGLELAYTLNKVTVGAYYHSPRYYPLVKQIGSSYLDVEFNPKNKLSTGFVTKADTSGKRTMLYSLTGQASMLKYLEAEAEVAMGQQNDKITKAYKASLHLNIPNFNSHLIYLYSDPDFTGFVHNSQRLSVGTAIQIKKFSLSVGYDYNSINMALDTLYMNMPQNKNINATLNYRLTPQTTFSVSGNQIALKDVSPTPLFDYVKTNGRLSFQSSLKKFNVTLIGDAGIMQNNLASSDNTQESVFANGTLSLFYLFTKSFSASLFASYQAGQKNITGYNTFYYGGAMTGQLGERYSLSAQYNSNYEWRYYTSDRSLFSMSFSGRINNNNQVNLTANYNLMKNTLDTKEYNVQLKYIHTIHMPVGKKKGFGSVSGRLVNNGVSKVDGILLNMSGFTTITDKDGNFKYPAVPVGTYYINVDASNLGMHVLTSSPGPNKVEVVAGKVTVTDIGLTTSGRISGQLKVEEDERSNQKGFIPVKENLDKLIVEVSSATELFRIYTDKDNAFNFEDLRPGEWQLKIYPQGLPAGYSLVQSIFNIELKPGQSERFEVMIKKKARQIQFQSTVKK